MWRDVPSLKDWEKLCETSGLTPAEVTTSLLAITQLLKEYHSIPKTKIEFFDKRMELLSQINEMSTQLMNLPKAVEPLRTIQKLAENKTIYLEKLKNHYKEAKPRHLSKNAMLETIKEREKTHGENHLLSLFGSTLIERLDPAHRTIEFNYSDIEKGLNRAEYPMNTAFYEWARETDPPPFFLWLEEHPLTTALEGISDNWRESYKTKITSVDYELRDKVQVQIEDEKLKIIPKDSLAEWPTLNTIRLKNISYKRGMAFGGAAFVWDKYNDNLFHVHPHKAGIYHHSSLFNGRKVRCAGMWLVKDGMVAMISNSSGHYKPDSLHFYQLIRFLHDKGVVNNLTQVADFLRPLPYTEGTRVPSNFIPLEEYFAWAEEQPFVQKYLKGEHLKPLSLYKEVDAGMKMSKQN
ncbi:hypothetical protein [Legionella sp. PC997]|uniref:hypothetical protein n=1 Tax=Legionella sp. PC997 TaxID=2755562 RepID=UPI0015F98B40|nr:hypothetical protein [Legionella sp. PC997]QMT58751.1 hypothetical protein HBNCFIEN_00104 [Legionella sp. PC997]